MDLHSLSTIINDTSGYLSINAATQQIEVKDSHFLGKLVSWIRYKTSNSYRQAVARTRTQLINILTTDKNYERYFKEKIGTNMPDIFKEDKPISARKVHRFIAEVTSQADQAQSAESVIRQQKLKLAESWVSRYSARDGKEIDSRMLGNKINAMLEAKAKAIPGVKITDINREGISEELYQKTMADKASIEAIGDQDQAEALVERMLSGIIDGRIIKAKEHRHSMLLARLSDAALPPEMRRKVESDIAAMRITTPEQLDQRINGLVLKQLTAQYDNLLNQACTSGGVERSILGTAAIRQSLPEYLLARANNKLSLATASQHALEFLREQGQAKMGTAKTWMSELVGDGAETINRSEIQSRVDRIFAGKIEDEEGLSKRNVDLYLIAEEIHAQAFKDLTSIRTKEQASVLVDELISNVVDQRIAAARAKLQARLKEQLAEIDLPEQMKGEMEADIDNMKIRKKSQIEQRVITFIMKGIDDDFGDLAAQAAKKHNCSKSMLTTPEMKEQLQKSLQDYLSERVKTRNPSVELTRAKALELLNKQRVELVENWVRRHSGMSDAEGRELFKGKLEALLPSNASAALGIRVEDIYIEKLEEEVGRQILDDPQNVAAIEKEEDAEAMASNILSALIKPRIEQARLEAQQPLYIRLSNADLSTLDYGNLETAITNSEITTMEELDAAISDAAIKQVDAEFDDLYSRVKTGVQFNEELGEASILREQVRDRLVSQKGDKILSVQDARAKASGLLEQWFGAKKEALAAIEQSRFNGVETLLKRLVLQEPYMAKAQVKEFQGAIEQTLDSVHQQNAEGYNALGMDENHMLAKLQRLSGGDALFNNLRTLARQAEKPSSVFDNAVWHANNIEGAVRNYASGAAGPLLGTYSRVEQLKGRVPDAVYQGVRGAVMNEGTTWGGQFISRANKFHVDALKENNNDALYRLLESPELALQAVGTKADGAAFTFKDLVDSAVTKKKDLKVQRKRRQAIDKLLPADEMNRLLNNMARDVSQIRNRVLDSSEANELFQRCTLHSLQTARINFEDQKIEFSRQPSSTPPLETTV